MQRGIILFAHGSRDPLWRAPVEAVAQRVRALSPGDGVACAYLELCLPDMHTAAAQLVADGARSLRILPLFLGVGKHVREDLPRLVDALRAGHPGLAVELLPSVGEHPQVLQQMARMALAENAHQDSTL